jgi:hypothetical protein
MKRSSVGRLVGLSCAMLVVGILIWIIGPRSDAPGPLDKATSATNTQRSSDVVAPQPLTSDQHSPQARTEQLSHPVDIRAVDPDGNELVVQPAAPSDQSVTAQQAVDEAWKHNLDLQPTSVTAAYGSLEGFGKWLVTFDGVCVIAPRPAPAEADGSGPGPEPSCVTQMTALIDGATGRWIETMGGVSI